MAASPTAGVVAVQVVPAGHPVAALPATMEAGCEEVQVRGGLGTTQPCTSTAAAVMVSDVPSLTIKLVSPACCESLVPTSSAMHCIGQVSNW